MTARNLIRSDKRTVADALEAVILEGNNDRVSANSGS